MSPIEPNAWLAKDILVHEQTLRGYLGRFLQDVADIEDVIQETYARLLSLNDSAWAAVRNWRAFLFTCARNAALDWPRKAQKGVDIVRQGHSQEESPSSLARDEGLDVPSRPPMALRGPGEPSTWSNAKRLRQRCRCAASANRRDIAPLAVFLAGDGASYLTGITCMAEGGY
jgi:hypothetical protein